MITLKLVIIFIIVFLCGMLSGIVLMVKTKARPYKDEIKWQMRHRMLNCGFCPVCLQGYCRITLQNVEIE